MNDIFKDMQASVGSDYLSDLPFYKRKVWHEIDVYKRQYVKEEDIVLKNKGNQNAGNPQNHTPQGQPKK